MAMRTESGHSIVDMIGGTPLIRLGKLEPRAGVELWAKAEFCNPGGSVKDRAALQMIRDGVASGALTRDKIIIDSTSGNTGVAYSMVGAALGFRVTLVMPANVSAARKQITAAYGTEIIFSSELEGSDGAIKLVRQLVAENPEKYFYPDQYSNESNPRAHYLGTGREIWEQTGGRVTHFVAGIGTTGTIMGTGRRLKEYSAGVQIVAVEPDDALHGLEGLKHLPSSIVPAIWHPEGIVDRRLPLSTDEAWDTAEKIAHEEGLFVGHSAGAAVAGALRVAHEVPAGERACIVTLLPDRGDRYFRPLKWEKHYEW
ncbi:MAG: Pyridoxal-5'-phosphate-dependent protein beta subunit [bacterium]|nr:Pyridoxal-5'-phosphate-dependent protein beta subunit [bacterium]